MDIFQFLQRVARVFSRKDGGMYGSNRFAGLTNHSENKHRLVVMTSLIWQPFDARFDEILQQMESHRTILKEVVDLDQKRANQEARDKAEEMWKAADKEHEKSGKATEAILDAFQKSEAARVGHQEEQRKAEIARLHDLEKRFTEARDEKQKQKIAAETREKARHEHENMSELRMKIEQLQRGMKRIQPLHVPILLTLLEDELTSRIQNWLSAPDFVGECEKALNTREEDTAEWLLDDPLFDKWKSSTAARSNPSKFERECLWVQGMTLNPRTSVLS